MKQTLLPFLVLALAGTFMWSIVHADGPRPLHAHNLSGVPATLSTHRLWTRTVQPSADSAPAFLPHVRLPNGKRRDVVYILAGNGRSNCDPSNPARQGRTYALDARSGATLWTRSTSGQSRCTTAGPTVDPNGRWVYSAGLDGRVHRYHAASGNEYRRHGWPKRVTLMPDVEKMSSTPTVGNGRLYVTTSGFNGDQGHYQGHVVTINLRTGKTTVFNTLCSHIRQLLGPTQGRRNYCASERSGLFGRGQGVIDPVTHSVYIVSGNGRWNGRTNWGDSILKLDTTGGRLLDAFTPTNQSSLDDGDLDLGSTGPALLPSVNQNGHQLHLLVQGGKGPACDSCSGVAVRLLNRDNFSGRKGPGHLGGDIQDLQAPVSCEILTAPVAWKSPTGRIWVFYANSCGVAGYRLYSPSRGKFRLARPWEAHVGGTTPVLHHGVLYVARSREIRAYKATTGQFLGRISGIGGVHWEYPLVAGNRLFMTDQSGHVFAFLL